MHSRNALLITAIIWPASYALLLNQAMSGKPITFTTFAWCSLVGLVFAAAVYARSWRGMHLKAGLMVNGATREEQSLSGWQISGLVGAGASIGLVVVPLGIWLLQRLTGIGYATQLMAVVVVIVSSVFFLLLIVAVLRAVAAFTVGDRSDP